MSNQEFRFKNAIEKSDGLQISVAEQLSQWQIAHKLKMFGYERTIYLITHGITVSITVYPNRPSRLIYIKIKCPEHDDFLSGFSRRDPAFGFVISTLEDILEGKTHNAAPFSNQPASPH